MLAAGHQALLFPSLKIQKLANTAQQDNYDVFIFISANAVEYGIDVLTDLHRKTQKIFAVGATTAKKLINYGFEVTAFPLSNASSEALLAMSEVRGLRAKDILIFRGKGGRETLKETLNKHNMVEYIEVYQRVECPVTPSHQHILKQFLQSDSGVIIITSIENLTNMMLMFEKINTKTLQLIKTYPLVVLSVRIKTYAQSIGFEKIEVAAKTNDVALVNAIQNCISLKAHNQRG